jgi:hypothetical protein
MRQRGRRASRRRAALTYNAGRMATFYRILAGEAPTANDFRSNRDKGLPPRGPELADLSLWTGLSLFDQREEAERRARRYRIGTHLAVLDLPAWWVADPTCLRKTLGPSHFTAWGTFPEFEPHIREVVPVRPAPRTPVPRVRH